MFFARKQYDRRRNQKGGQKPYGKHQKGIGILGPGEKAVAVDEEHVGEIYKRAVRAAKAQQLFRQIRAKAKGGFKHKPRAWQQH